MYNTSETNNFQERIVIWRSSENFSIFLNVIYLFDQHVNWIQYVIGVCYNR